MASPGRSTPELEMHLPAGTPILRAPFTGAELRAAVAKRLSADGNGTGPQAEDGSESPA